MAGEPRAKQPKRLRLTIGQRRLIDSARRLGPIRIERSIQGRHCFFDNGSLVSGRQLDALVKKGFLAPVGDALLPGDTQSYRLTDKEIPVKDQAP